MDLEKATESTLAKAFTRFGMPVMLAVIATLGGWILQDIRTEVREQGTEQASQGRDVQQVNNKVDLLNAKVDNGLVWRITELERRINTVEEATSTP